MITGSFSRLLQATRQGPVAGRRHKDVFPHTAEARHPGPEVNLAIGIREQAEGATAADNYWSSTTNADNPSNAWNVNFNNGNVNNANKNNSFRVRAVRGGW